MFSKKDFGVVSGLMLVFLPFYLFIKFCVKAFKVFFTAVWWILEKTGILLSKVLMMIYELICKALFSGNGS